jgi:hypothetical protein
MNNINLNNIDDSDHLIKEIYEGKIKIKERKDIIRISTLKYNIFPLYDIKTFAIYLVEKEFIHERIINEDFRFPDLQIIHNMESEKKKLIKDLENAQSDEDNYLLSIKISTLKKSLEFISNFDTELLKKRFEEVFDEGNLSNYKEFSGCVRRSYTSILPNTYYIRPYFTLNQLEKNRIIYGEISDKDTLEDLCYKSIIRDLPYSILIKHQKHIIINKGAGILQYYSLIGSYQINNYLRELYEGSQYKNNILEELIKKFWNIIITSPSFEDSFYIYRFINDDKFLEKIKIGDIYQDKGFLSCTRDPFYSSQYYDFGENLMKIKVPKNKKGVGLCLELFSHFGREQEVLLAPMTSLKLIKKDAKVKYEHINMGFNMKLKNKYEFEIVDISPVKINNKILPKTKTIEKFVKLDNLQNMSQIFEEIKEKYLDEVNQVKIKIGDKLKTFTIDKIKVSPIYAEKLFYVGSENDQPNDEIIIYYIENNEIVLFVEILKEETGEFNIFVNFNNINNYIIQRIEEVFDINDLLKFLKNVGDIFQVEHIVMSCDFISCEYFKDEKKLKYLIEDYKDIRSGNFNLEIYSYFKNKDTMERFSKYKNIIIPQFDFKILNKYFKLPMENIINLTDVYELKQILLSVEKVKNKKISVRDFYIYLKENKCYLIGELSYIISLYEDKINSKDKDKNIFYNPFYIIHTKFIRA